MTALAIVLTMGAVGVAASGLLEHSRLLGDWGRTRFVAMRPEQARSTIDGLRGVSWPLLLVLLAVNAIGSLVASAPAPLAWVLGTATVSVTAVAVVVHGLARSTVREVAGPDRWDPVVATPTQWVTRPRSELRRRAQRRWAIITAVALGAFVVALVAALTLDQPALHAVWPVPLTAVVVGAVGWLFVWAWPAGDEEA